MFLTKMFGAEKDWNDATSMSLAKHCLLLGSRIIVFSEVKPPTLHLFPQRLSPLAQSVLAAGPVGVHLR